jgi:uncharacterized protein (TIGR03067 family)
MKLRIIPALFVVALLGSNVKLPEPKDELEGTWAPDAFVYDGSELEPDPRERMVVKEGTVSVFGIKGELEHTMRYKLDPKQKPKTIDLSPTGGLYKGTVRKGIYEIDGKVLQICFPLDQDKEGVRPSSIGSEKGSDYEVQIYSREQK